MKQEIARESSKPKVTSLPFSAIPHQSKLFLQYLNDPSSLREFYPNAVESVDDLREFSSIVLGSYETDRDKLCDALTRINTRIRAGESTHQNIDRLRDPDTVAVVTGQQAGLFSGPLYTIYKALSAVALAKRLSENETSAVPVFWAATEDHDFEEVAQASFLDRTGQTASLKYDPADRAPGTQVGSIKLDTSIEAAFGRLADELPQTEFSGDLLKTIKSSWPPGSNFADGFLTMLADILGAYGIIYLDPMEAALKQLASPVFEAAISKSNLIADVLTKRDVELDSAGFHAQVSVEKDHFPVFRIADDGRREALRITDGGFRIKGGREEFAAEDLIQELHADPERFSGGVILRPVVQDYLLPTVCYLGGGAEIAYFAQNSEVYRILDRPATPIFHRQSFTVVEARQRRILERLELKLPDMFPGVEPVKMRTANQIAPEIAKLFAEVEERTNTELDRLDHAVAQIDLTVAASLAKRRQKIIYHLAATRDKTLRASLRRDETIERQIDGLFDSLLPHGALQERSLSVFMYLNKYGGNFIDWIYQSIDLDDRGHRIIEL